MIILITTETEEGTIVSHGIDTETFKNIVFPVVHPREIGYFNTDIGEWVLKE